jgi:5-methylcytosine-specific restriction enzyme subunit McrC
VQPLIVLEGEPLPLSQHRGRVDLIKRLMRISDAAPFPVFSLSRRGELRAGQVVGTVTCGDTRIEILPKTADGDVAQDRDFLLNMLRFCGYVDRYTAAAGSVQEIDTHPIEVLIAEIADDISSGLRAGVPRRYQGTEAESPVIRGRIDFTRLARRLPGVVRMPIRYAPLVIGNDLARLIKWVAHALLRITRSVRTEEKLSSALGTLHEIDITGFSSREANRLKLSRFESRWQRTVTIARLLLEGSSLNPTLAGAVDGTAVVFPLERLFERCLRQLLPLALPDCRYSVSYRTDPLYMLSARGGDAKAIRLKPDYVYRKEGHTIAVADAKWKRLAYDDPAYEVDRADVYQTASYLLRYQLRDALLFFPRVAWMPPGWAGSFDIPRTDLHLHLIGVDIESLISPQPALRAESLVTLKSLVSRVLRLEVDDTAAPGASVFS